MSQPARKYLGQTVPVKEARANGFRVTRKVTPVQEKQSGKVTRGAIHGDTP